jgi:hypothetical protein
MLNETRGWFFIKQKNQPPRAPNKHLGMILLSCTKNSTSNRFEKGGDSSCHSFTYATNKRKPYLLLVAIIHACM